MLRFAVLADDLKTDKMIESAQSCSVLKTISKEMSQTTFLLSRIMWSRVLFLVIVPAYGLAQVIWTPLRLPTFCWAVFWYILTGVGVTAGYHRLWAHTSYSATLPLRIFLALAGIGAMEESIRWWAAKHRSHHRYTDTDKDPYTVQDGFWHAHMGWLLLKKESIDGRVDISDLDSDPVVVWQNKHSLWLQVLMGMVIPVSIAGLCWNDWWGGFIYAGILRVFAVQQATFCVNSLAHWLGESPFDDRHSPKDHYITAFFTFGEGYHNFHHSFPSDYRNALEWYQYDPTKWVIRFWKYVGLAFDLKEFRASEVEKSRLQQSQKSLDAMQEDLTRRLGDMDWGIPMDGLPVMEWEEYVRLTKEDGKMLVAIAGVIHDVGDFVTQHPGGKALIKSGVGKDATASFNGGVYSHSKIARNMLAGLRVAVLHGGGEVEVWKSQPTSAV